jgi:hypothetical protein
MLIDCSTDSETQPRQSYNMTYHQTNHGPGSIHTTTTQKLNLSSSLLNTPFVPAGQQPNKKKFRCTWEGCTRSFDSPHNVKQHVREAHTGEKPHVCNACWANGVRSAFTRPFGLTRHMQQVLGHLEVLVLVLVLVLPDRRTLLRPLRTTSSQRWELFSQTRMPRWAG